MALFPVAIIADDLTGAADTAAKFARPGRTVPVSLEALPRSVERSSVFAVTTESRACSPELARERVSAAAAAATASSSALIYKKIDSNLRGNIGVELAALRDAGLGPIVLAPAFPTRGRTTVHGIALADGTPVAETEMGQDPEAPVAHSAISGLLQQQADRLQVGHCYLDFLRHDPAALARLLAGCDVLIVDAETDADLDLIAASALALSPPPVLAGSAGLAGAVAARLLGPPVHTAWPERRSGPLLAVLASSSERLLRQVAALPGGAVITIPLPCAMLTWENDFLPELNDAIARAVTALRAGRDALVYAAGPLPDAPNPVGLVVEHLAHLALVAARQGEPKGMLVGGGSTAQAVLTTLATDRIEVDDEPLPGIAAGIAVGGDLDGRPIVLKPGAAGDERAVAQIIHYLGRRAAALEAEP